jgi:hypothetical protein
MGLDLAGAAPKNRRRKFVLNQRLLEIHSRLVFLDFVHPFFALSRVVVAAADSLKETRVSFGLSRRGWRIVVGRIMFASTPLRSRAYAARSLREDPKKFHRTGGINVRERYDIGKLETFCFAGVLFVLRRIIKSIVPVLAASFSLFSSNSGNPSIFEIPGPGLHLPRAALFL